MASHRCANSSARASFRDSTKFFACNAKRESIETTDRMPTTRGHGSQRKRASLCRLPLFSSSFFFFFFLFSLFFKKGNHLDACERADWRRFALVDGHLSQSDGKVGLFVGERRARRARERKRQKRALRGKRHSRRVSPVSQRRSLQSFAPQSLSTTFQLVRAYWAGSSPPALGQPSRP